jgi:endonuclease-3
VERLLAAAYPDARCTLDFTTPFQCLVATTLSAQTTDQKVNQVTPTLFRVFPDPEALSRANLAEIAAIIRPLGLAGRKSRHLRDSAIGILQRFQGKVPPRLEDLVTLPGVGRKTANCVLLNAFGKPGLMCDTHFCRLTRRLGFHHLDDPEKIEALFRQLLPPAAWGGFSHRLIAHGRALCQARKPACELCPLRCLCVMAKSTGPKGPPRGKTTVPPEQTKARRLAT